MNKMTKKFRLSIILIWLFFVALLFVYGRGISFDAKLDQLEKIYNNKDLSKAPFLISSTIILFLITNRKSRFNFSKVANGRLWILYFVIILLLTFFREDFFGEVKNFGTLFFSYSLLFLITRFAYNIPFNRLEEIFIKISFIVSILSVCIHLLQGNHVVFFPDRTESNFDRLGGLFYYAHTAAIIGVTLLFSLKKYKETKIIKYLLICVVCIFLLVATDTRSAWFATLLSIAFIMFKNKNFYLMFFCSLLLYFAVTNFNSMVGTKSLETAEEDKAYRGQIWSYSIIKASKNLLIGYGSQDPFEKNNFSLNDNLKDPHNSFLSLLLKNGLVVTIFYLFIYFNNISQCLNKYRNDYNFLFFFWLFFPFFWGKIYNDLSSFISMYMMFTIYVFALNPNSSGESKLITQPSL